MTFTITSHVHPDALGLLPTIARGDDPRPFTEQVDERYAHGGGWNAFGQDQWTMDEDGTLHYPEDPPFRPLAWWPHQSDGSVFFTYPYAICAIRHPSGEFEVARLD